MKKSRTVSIIFVAAFILGIFLLLINAISFAAGGFHHNFIQNNNSGILLLSLFISFFSAIGYKKIVHKKTLLKIMIVICVGIMGYLALGGVLHIIGFCPEYFNFMPALQIPEVGIKEPVFIIEIIQKVFCPFSRQAF